jgi:hypothetical protein
MVYWNGNSVDHLILVVLNIGNLWWTRDKKRGIGSNCLISQSHLV